MCCAGVHVARPPGGSRLNGGREDHSNERSGAGFFEEFGEGLAVGGFTGGAEDAPAAGLPDFARGAIECGEPAVAPAAGVNAGGESEVEDFAVALLGVTHGHWL